MWGRHKHDKFAHAGAKVTAVDISTESLKIARSRSFWFNRWNQVLQS